MTPEEFRRHGREVVDWIADYWERLGDLPVQSSVAPGDVRRALPLHPPQQGEPFADVLRDLDDVVVPGLTHWQHPGWFAYFPASTSGPSVLGDLVSSGLGVQGMLWATSPAATELETHVLDWLADLLDLPPVFRSGAAGGGVVQDSASSSTLVALVAARERASAGQANRSGPRGLVAYTSSQAHSSVEKAVRIAGLGSESLRVVPVDHEQRLRPDALAAAMDDDVAAGRRPCFVTATVGTTGTGAVDPLRAVGEVARAHGAWLHVDAAMHGSAAVCPEHRWIHDGLELADSYVFDPHKWLLTGFDCSAFFVADRAALVQALSVVPEYLRNAATESGEVIDYRDWMVPLGRRFRALKLWFVLRWYGADGLREHLRGHVALAQDLARWVDGQPALERVAPAPLSLVCLAHVDGDQATQRLLDAVNGSGEAFVTHTRLDGRLVLRISVGSATTGTRHVARLKELLAAGLDAEPGG